MACCVLIAGVIAAVLAFVRVPGRDAANDARAWRLTKDRVDD